MTTPPFQNIRLAPGETLDPAKQQEVFDAIMRNMEDTYERLGRLESGVGVQAGFVKSITNGATKIAFGESTLNWLVSKNSNKVEVTHGLNVVPKVFLQIEDPVAPFATGVSLDANLIARSKTKLTMAGTCSEAITAAFNCCWLAIG